MNLCERSVLAVTTFFSHSYNSLSHTKQAKIDVDLREIETEKKEETERERKRERERERERERVVEGRYQVSKDVACYIITEIEHSRTQILNSKGQEFQMSHF